MSITSKDYIIVNGKSSHEVGLYIDTPPMPTMSTQTYQTLNIPGRTEALTLKDKAREDITVVINAYLFDDEAFNPNDLYAFLSDAKTLSTSKSADYYYKVRRLENIIPSYSGKGKQFLEITFVVSPLRYATDNEPVSSPENMFTVKNDGTYFSQPIYKLYGNGTITLMVNEDEDNQLVIENAKDYVIVDSERMICHKDGVVMRSKGQLPFFSVGLNMVETNATRTEITVNKRWL